MSTGSKDGAFLADAKLAAGIDSNGNEHPLNCDDTGTLQVAGVVDVIPGAIFEITGEVEVKNDAGSPIPISGSVNVSNLPATQPVSGTVSVSNFPATQPISAVSLPLPVNAATQSTLAALSSNIALTYGTFSYYAGTSGTVTVAAGQRVLSASCHSTMGGSMTINGGAAIPIPANVGFSIDLLGNLVAPVIVYTDTDSYFVQAVV